MGRRRAKRVVTEGFRPTANPEFARYQRDLGASSAASPHTPTPRKGTRRERERQAIRDQRRDQ